MANTNEMAKPVGGRTPRVRLTAEGSTSSAGWVFLLPLLALWAIPVLLLGFLVPFSRGEESLSLRPSEVKTVVVGSRFDSAQQSVDVQVSAPPPAQVKSATAGLVTKVSVAAAATITNGMPLMVVAGAPVLAYRADAPLYRDLALGATGADVQELGVWLHGLGLLVSAANGSKYTATFAAAVTKLEKKYGLSPEGIMRVSLLAWVPAQTNTADTVKVRLGDTVAVGDVLVEGASAPTAIAIALSGVTAARPNVPPGALRLTAGANHIDVESLNLTAAERAKVATFLTQQVAAGTVSTAPGSTRTASGAAGSGTESSGDATVSTTYTGTTLAAAAAKKVGVVPSSAVFSSTSGTICVFERLAATASNSTERTTALAIAAPEMLLGELGSISVPAKMIGKTIIRNPTSLPAATQKLCR